MSHQELAEKIGIPRGRIARRLAADDWRIGELARIADALGVPLSTLTGDRP